MILLLQRTALHWSAAFNNKDSVRLLIKYNCNAAVSDVEGKTPLHWAANTHDQTVDATLKILLVRTAQLSVISVSYCMQW